MMLGFRDLRGADINTGFKKGTFVLPATSVQQVERVIDRRDNPRTRKGPSFEQQLTDTLMAFRAACVG
ncbi:hypothetical protein [Streptomyces sp. MAR25Y5]|uniref:hypothetical protein n=1 Tax=Streptomyces sp. MAR25Y5 TaxID=2962028 RepID=UPI0007EDE0D7|nr:hypothetical protein [Streptomyces sp. MAR25Y5]MCP3771555.1 hypothetical protein [Streptomyces sp. MAR25Y5]OBQ50451.1 hypothetical protein A4U61_09585 [Streptomyces sp. H-KF8]